MAPAKRFSILLLITCCGLVQAQTPDSQPKPISPYKSVYTAKLAGKIKNNLRYPVNLSENQRGFATYRIYLHPDGEVLRVTLVSSSGVPEFDQAVEKAILKSSPFPKRDDGSVDAEISLTYHMKE